MKVLGFSPNPHSWRFMPFMVMELLRRP